MTAFNAHRKAVEIERDRLVARLETMEQDPTATLAEMRVVQRQLEHIKNKLIWFESPLSRLHFRD